MSPQEKTPPAQRLGESTRQAVHDTAAAIIAIRALAEMLAEHLPVLTALARTKGTAAESQIPPSVLDEIPALPAEILKLCVLAERGMRSIGRDGDPAGEPSRPQPPPWEAVAGRRSALGGEAPEVLLVEDQPRVRYVLGEILVGLGCSVTSVADGEEALRLLETRSVDLVLADLRMPGLTGWELARRAREPGARHKDRDILIVGLTASPLPEDARRARAAGMDEVLVKPVDEAALRAVLDRLPRIRRGPG
jgi:CheY-like chemotaxis protein